MKVQEYPALYQAADSAAAEAQEGHFRTLGWLAVSSILSAGLSLYGIATPKVAFCAAALLFVSLGLTILLAVKNFEAAWYRARAVTESIKTITWRFMMKSEPFNSEDANRLFAWRLKQILGEHKDLGHALAGPAGAADQITERMLAVRNMTVPERCLVYGAERVNEQRQWYDKKSQDNKRNSRIWITVVVVLYSMAILTVSARIAQPSWEILPTELLIVAAASALGWIQAKRYRELAAAYALTAHEIGLASVDFSKIANEADLSSYVTEMENAFSREHTQWVARRDF